MVSSVAFGWNATVRRAPPVSALRSDNVSNVGRAWRVTTSIPTSATIKTAAALSVPAQTYHDTPTIDRAGFIRRSTA